MLLLTMVSIIALSNLQKQWQQWQPWQPTVHRSPFAIHHACAQPDWGVCLSAGLSLPKPSEGESLIMKYLRRWTRFESPETLADKDAKIADV